MLLLRVRVRVPTHLLGGMMEDNSYCRRVYIDTVNVQ